MVHVKILRRLTGNIENMNMEQKNALTGLAMQEAKSDPRMKVIEAEEANIRGQATGDKQPDAAALGLVENRRNALYAEYGNRIAAMYGWRSGGSRATPNGAQTFAHRIMSGEFGHAGEFDEARAQAEMRKAGVSENEVMQAVQGGGGQ